MTTDAELGETHRKLNAIVCENEWRRIGCLSLRRYCGDEWPRACPGFRTLPESPGVSDSPGLSGTVRSGPRTVRKRHFRNVAFLLCNSIISAFDDICTRNTCIIQRVKLIGSVNDRFLFTGANTTQITDGQSRSNINHQPQL